MATSAWTPVDESAWKPVEETPEKPKGFFSSLWEKANPINVVKGVAETASHPLDSLKAWHDQSKALKEKAESALKANDYEGAAVHGLNFLANMIPGLGQAMDEAAEAKTPEEFKAKLGSAVGTALSLKELEVAPKAIQKAAETTGKVARATVEAAKGPGVGNMAIGASELASAVPMTLSGHLVGGTSLGLSGVRNILEGIAERRAAVAPEVTPVPRELLPVEKFLQDGILPEATGKPIETPVEPTPEVPIEPEPIAAEPPVARQVPQEAAAPPEPAPVEPHDPMPIRLADAEFKRGLVEKDRARAAAEVEPVQQPAALQAPEQTVSDAPIPKAYLNQETTGLQIAAEQHNRTVVSRKVAKDLVERGYRAVDLAALRKSDPTAYATLLEDATKNASKQAKAGKDYSASPDTQARILVEMRKVQPSRKTNVGKMMESIAEPSTASPELIEKLKKAGVLDKARELAQSIKESDARDVTEQQAATGTRGAVSEGLGQQVPQPSGAIAKTTHGDATEVIIPGSDDAYPARYKIVELEDIQASHSGETFQPNPKYGLKNDRDYSQPENQGKVVEGALKGKFKPQLHITDNPDASNGPVVIDASGNALGGNGRTMMLQRVHRSNPEGTAAYRAMLEKKARQFGIDPETLKNYKQPVLVREVANDLATKQQQNAITELNRTGTQALKPSERAMSESRRVSQSTLQHVSERLDDAGEGATLSNILEGESGRAILDRLIDDGAISKTERAGLEVSGKLTSEAKTRISKLMLGRFFRDPAQLDTIAPAIRTKIERVAAPLASAESVPGWGVTDEIKASLDLIEEARAHGNKNIDMYLKQKGMFGDQEFAAETVELAKALQKTPSPIFKQAVEKYVEKARYAHDYRGPGMFNNFPDPVTSDAAFGEFLSDLKRPKKSTIADLMEQSK